LEGVWDVETGIGNREKDDVREPPESRASGTYRRTEIK